MRYFLYVVFSFLSISCLQGQTFQIGDKLPDIVAANLNGNEISLYSLRGKMVLVDFWAGWCAPCRKENPSILKAYKKYKDTSFKNGEGFTVFSVSLDKEKKMWELTVKKDSMVWPYHVCDFQGFKGPIAKLYSVKSIPQSYLIDGDGIVVAVNPRGDALAVKLRKCKKPWYATLGL